MDKHTLFCSFGKWIAPINFQQLQEQVMDLRQDAYTKKLTTKAYIQLFLLAHLQETDSLPAISVGLLNEDLQQAVGFETISPSQLSRKHRGVDPSLLSTIFVDLLHQIA